MKRILIVVLTITCILLNSFLSYANGGPGDMSAVVKGGNVEFYDIETVKIVSENINIKLEENNVKVKVKYILENQGESLSTRYAFPVDIIENEHFWGTENDYVFTSNFVMLDNGDLLNYEVIEGEFGDFGGENYTRRKVDYYTADLSFEKGEMKELVVEYDVTPGFMDWGTSKDPFPWFDSKTFFYNLSPASHWGDGIIGSFILEIDTSDIDLIDGSVTEVNFPVSEENGLLVYREEDFAILDNPELLIDYEYEQKMFDDFIMFHNGMKQITSVTSSSSLDGYGVTNLFDDNISTCWAEGSQGLGIGDWIRIDLDEPTSVMGLYMSNGYYKDEKSFANNSRIKEATLNVYSDNPVNGESVRVVDLEFGEREYGIEFWDLHSEVMHSYYEDVTSIELIIKDVYRGEKYDDVCISEFLFLTYNTLNDNDISIDYIDNSGDIYVFEGSGDTTLDLSNEEQIVEEVIATEANVDIVEEKEAEEVVETAMEEERDEEIEEDKDIVETTDTTEVETITEEEGTTTSGPNDLILVAVSILLLVCVVVAIFWIRKKKIEK